MYNNRKFCFILCTNDKMFEKEALKYVQSLEIPEGYEVEILSVIDACSMASGYNEAMQASDAKYKIYLHQDVFIVKKDFLNMLLEIFQNPTIGMIGMVGVLKMPAHGIMWYTDRIGKLYANTILESIIWSGMEFENTIQEVEAIDGLLMATQYDLHWRDDLFTGWDFYDASQSMELRKRGYKIVVPRQQVPWCIHDQGMNNLERYYQYRKVFINEYRDFILK